MEINTHNRIEFRLEVEEEMYSFIVPHGSSLENVKRAASGFLTGVVKLEAEHKEKKSEENEEKVDDELESN